jgi:hypothetical protein
MVFNSLKTEAKDFSNYYQVGLKNQVASSEIQVGSIIRVLGVMFDSKLSWRRTKTTMVTKNWTSKVELSRFPNNGHEAFLLINGEIS